MCFRFYLPYRLEILDAIDIGIFFLFIGMIYGPGFRIKSVTGMPRDSVILVDLSIYF